MNDEKVYTNCSISIQCDTIQKWEWMNYKYNKMDELCKHNFEWEKPKKKIHAV